MHDYTKLKVAELKDLIKSRGIEATGLTKKQQFIDALEAEDAENGHSAASQDQKTSNAKPTAKANGKKRAAPASPPAPEPKKVKADLEIGGGQIAKSSKMTIPLDDYCDLPTYRVYVDSKDGIIYDATLNQTNAGNNNNKFYRIQILVGPKKDYKTWTRWGRVSERGQSAVLGDGSLEDAIKHFGKKFKDKSGLKWEDRGQVPKAGKYAFFEKNYEDDDDEDSGDAQPTASNDAAADGKTSSAPECTLEPPVRRLMELIFNQQYIDATMSQFNYDANKLPLGKLSKATISRGFQILKDLSALIDDTSAASDPQTRIEIEDLSNRYFSTIPHDFGRSRPPVIRYQDDLKREVELLESLSDLKDGNDILKKAKDNQQEQKVHPLDLRYQALGMQEVTPLSPKSTEFSHISDYLLKTCGDTHGHINYKVEDIFRIERQGEMDRFEKSPFATMASDRRLLWHGSRATNFGGILSQGLRIAPPEAPVSGYMFDKGIYLADMSSKSANYCCSFISGNTGLLLLCEAELGKPMQVLTGAKYDASESAKAAGVYSTWGQGTTGPKGWKDAGVVNKSLAGVMMPDTTTAPGPTGVKDAYLYYNEYICYDVSQVRLRYLLRVKM